ncbi:hypothetical protein ACQ5SO_12010 [Rhodovulum sp. DZ06]|uniref:hypothetical protein n=1 Tax=Rhodovulum sp. DZ06 TaxID=3425126 RepID=UPI003D3317E4
MTHRIASALVAAALAAPLLALSAAPAAAEAMDDAKPAAKPAKKEKRPYTEAVSRSREEIEAILAGEEWGDDSVAGAYGYPSPGRVIRWSGRLNLSPGQLDQVYEIHDDMVMWAKMIAPKFLDAEAELEELFRSGRTTPGMIRKLTEESAALEAQLRAIHLSARAKMRSKLTREQMRAYDLFVSGEG